jgi:flagellar protein FliT
MIDEEEGIFIYENVSTITDQMLVAAQKQDWEQLERLESQCSQLIDVIKTRGPMAPVKGQMRERKIHLIKKILHDDRLIRDVTQPWMKKLQDLIHNTANRRKLSQHYLADDSA